MSGVSADDFCVRNRGDEARKRDDTSYNVSVVAGGFIRGTARVRCSGEEVGLRWFGDEQRRDSEYISGGTMSKRSRGRPERRFMDIETEHMKGRGCRGWR